MTVRIVTLALLVLLGVVCGVSARHGLQTDGVPYEPIYHIRPPNNWINDPNGAYRDPVTGKIHLYFQYNPNGAVWGDMNWYHVTSDDYVHWQRHGIAATNSDWYDVYGVYSGTMMNNNHSEPVAIYTCVEKRNDMDIQNQCIMNPAKRDLAGARTFNELLKSPVNVVMSFEDVPSLVNSGSFRDPTEWWEDPAHPGTWLIAFVARMNIESGAEAGDNAHVVLFRTSDPTFQSGYTFSHSLYVYKYDLYHMFECPDFFVLTPPSTTGDTAQEHFLKVSTMPSHRDYIIYGSYELDASSNQYVFVEDPARSFTFCDYGPYYAAKAFWDPILNRRRIWGWVREDLTDDAMRAQGWSGVQILRDMEYVSAEGKLKYPAIPELKALRLRHIASATNVPVTEAPTTALVNNASIYHDIVVRFTISDASVFDATATYEDGAAPEIGVLVRANSDLSENVAISLKMPTGGPTALTGQAYVETFPAIKIFPGPDAANCSAECTKDRLCESYTYWNDGNCKLYWLTNPLESSADATSGTVREPLLTLDRSASTTTGFNYTQSGRAPFTQATPSEFELRILVDDSVIEVYKDDGLEVMSARVYIPAGDASAGIALYQKNLGAATVTADIDVYSMGSIWHAAQPSAVTNFTNALNGLLTALVPQV